MLKRNHKNVVLDLQNQNSDPLKLVISCGPIKKRKWHSKNNDNIKRNIYAWITLNPQVVQDCLKVMFDDQIEPQLVPKCLLQVSVRELNNSLISDPNDGGIKYARDEDDNIIVSDSTLRILFPPQLKKCQNDTRSCVVVNVEFLLKLYIFHSYPGVIGIKKNQGSKTKFPK